MDRPACSAVLLLTLFSAAPVAAQSIDSVAKVPAARSGRVDVRLFDLAAVRRLVHTLVRRGDGMSEGEARSSGAVRRDAGLRPASPGAGRSRVVQHYRGSPSDLR
jgi:hypothetical protein